MGIAHKYNYALVSLCFILALACSRQGGGNSTSAEPVKVNSAGEGVKIGIAKIAEHEALDAVEKGIQDEIAKRGITAEYDLENANGDLTAADQIAGKFKSEKVNAAVGIATPMAAALVSMMGNIPVIFSAVTDPVSAKLVTSIDHGEENVAGLSDAIPTVEQIGLFKQLAKIKTLGFIYNSSESNSLASRSLVEEGCKKYGITLEGEPINTSADLRAAALDLIGRVDGIYVSTDNMVCSAISVLIQVCHSAKKPIFCGDPTCALNGGCVVANGINYYTAGLATGDIVADILQGRKPQDIPVKFLSPTESDLLFDLDEAANCGIKIPNDLLDKATYVFQAGKLTHTHRAREGSN